jgi:glycerol-3-phosphate acyltransferase PlsY
VLQTVLLILCAYLLGSIPTGLLLAKAAGVDIRAAGSGNIGATNVYRTLGRSVGILTLVGDCLKGLIPVLVAQRLGMGDAGIAAAGTAAFLGHVYTVFLRFKGGKGVATALGVFLGVSPASVGIALVIFIAVVAAWRYISLGSVTAAGAMPFIVAGLDGRPLIIAMSAVIALLVIWKHRENISRLRAGTENKFKA